MTEEKRKKMRDEAVERLRMLNLHPNVLKDFVDGKVNYSERTPLGGILYWLDNEEKFVKVVKEFEEEYDALVYHCTHECVGFDECLTCLYVSSSPNEWENDKKDIKERCGSVAYVYAYVCNLDCPMNSEIGEVGIKEAAGGIVRVA